jgi:ribonuclease D
MGLTTPQPAAIRLVFILCPGGGIGRRAGFRYLWPQGRGSSSLLLGTNFFHPLRVRGSEVTKLIATELHTGDLPAGIDFGDSVAVDTETMGLNPHRDRLCVVQLSAGDGVCHVVHFPEPAYDAPILKALMTDDKVTKLFHFARFDVAVMRKYLGIVCRPVYCTKIASKMTRTFTDRHGLKDLCRDLLGVELSKEQQSSDWGAEGLTPEQIRYAASDVLYLHELRRRLDVVLAREGRAELAEACFRFMPARAELDLAGWDDPDIFQH